jgi:ABC-type multidrug transport system ATPase subunit
LTAVDAETRNVLTDVLAELHAQGTTLLISTHDVETMDMDELVYLHGGRVLPSGMAAHAHDHHGLAQWTG